MPVEIRTHGPASSVHAHVPAEPAEAPAEAVLPAPQEVALPILGRLHMLMIRSNEQSRETDRRAEERFDAEERAHDAARVQEMRDKADDAFANGMVCAALQLGSGVSSAIANGKHLAKLLHGSEEQQKIAETNVKLVEGVGKASDGARAAIEAGGRSLAGHADARIAEHESAAKAARRAADRLRSEQDAAKQAEARTMQLAAEIAQAHEQSLRAAILRA